ncbi:MAG: phosphotransferase [Cohaesibacter sp.]|nr:phosphotransferase [Cohaesibacter sp.]
MFLRTNLFPLTNPNFAQFIEELGLLGLEQSTATDPQASAFAILKAASIDRWLLVPLQNRTSIASAFRMLTPMSLHSRLAKCAALSCNHIGLRPIWTRNRIYLKAMHSKPCLHNWSSAAFFSGTPGPDRKITVQLRSMDSRQNAYLKLACSPQANTLIAHEIRALKRAKQLKLATAILPQILAYTHFACRRAYICSDETKPNCQSARRLKKKHVAFLEEMARKTAAPLSVEYADILRNKHKSVATKLTPLANRIALRALDEIIRILDHSSVYGALAHGDFTPWNCRLTDGQLYVFDWEQSRTHPLGYDHLHFLISTDTLDAITLKTRMQERWHEGSREGAQLLLVSYFLRKLLNGSTEAAEVLREVMQEQGQGIL